MRLLEAPPTRCPIAPAIGACVPTAMPPIKPTAIIVIVSINLSYLTLWPNTVCRFVRF